MSGHSVPLRAFIIPVKELRLLLKFGCMLTDKKPNWYADLIRCLEQTELEEVCLVVEDKGE